MSPSTTRRRFLRLAGAASVGLAGCLDRGTGDDDPTTAPTTDTASTESPPPTSETYGPTSGPDERVTRTPPGDPALPVSGEWPEYRFDAGNTGYNPDVEPPQDAAEYWRLNGGGSPTVADETVFNLHGRGREKRTFVRRDPATMAERSATPLVEYGANSPPVVAGDRAFVTSFVEVFCLSTDRDEVLWRGPAMDGIHAPPAVSDGLVVVSGGGFHGVPTHLRAFDVADGTPVWRYDLDSDAKGAPAVADGTVYVATAGHLHAVDLSTGERRFRVAAETNEWTTPVATTAAVYVPTTEDELLALAPDDGSEQWRTVGRGVPVVADDVLHVGGDDGVVTLERDDGSEVQTVPGGRPLARAGQTLLVGGQSRVEAYTVGEQSRLWVHVTPEVQVEDQILRGVYDAVPLDGGVYVVAADGFHGLGPARE